MGERGRGLWACEVGLAGDHRAPVAPLRERLGQGSLSLLASGLNQSLDVADDHVGAAGQRRADGLEVVAWGFDDRAGEDDGPWDEDGRGQDGPRLGGQPLQLLDVERLDRLIFDPLAHGRRERLGVAGDALDVGRVDAPFAVDAEGYGFGRIRFRVVGVQLHRDAGAGDLAGGAGGLDDGQQREAHVGVLLLLDHASAPRGCRVVDHAEVDLLDLGRHG